MIGGIIALAIAAIGAAYAGLVLRSAPHRRDNLVFGALALTDAAMTAWRGLNVLAGEHIVDSAVAVPCSVCTIVLAVLTIEFLAAFPRRAPMRWRWRALVLVWSAGGATMLIAAVPLVYSQWLYFAPITFVTFGVGVYAFRRTKERDARTVIAMLWFRWAFGFFAYFVAPRFGFYESAVWAETTFATLVSFIVIGTAVLRNELFSVRSSAAEAIVIATIALVVVLCGGGAIWLVQTYTTPGTLQQALLVGATLIPLAIAGLGHAMYPRVERRVLAGLDERRARRLHVQGDPIPAEATEAIAEAKQRIGSIGDGSDVRWVPAVSIEAEVVPQIISGQPARIDKQPGLPACLIVPALGAGGTLVGAFYLTGGLIDRDTYLVASATRAARSRATR